MGFARLAASVRACNDAGTPSAGVSCPMTVAPGCDEQAFLGTRQCQAAGAVNAACEVRDPTRRPRTSGGERVASARLAAG